MAAILKGVDAIFDEWLGLTGRSEYGTAPNVPKYVSRMAAVDLSRNGGPLDKETRPAVTPSEMIGKAMARLTATFDRLRIADKIQSLGSNWKWTKSRRLPARSHSAQSELLSYITLLLDDRWASRVPICKGLGPGGNSCCVDMAFRPAPTECELIGLRFGPGGQKFGAGTPLEAAMEVLCSGLLHLLFRSERLLLSEHSLLGADVVSLVVLAPEGCYRFNTRARSTGHYEFGWLEKAITEGLQAYVDSQAIDSLAIGFRFEVLSDEFLRAYDGLIGAADRFRTCELGPRSAAFA